MKRPHRIAVTGLVSLCLSSPSFGFTALPSIRSSLRLSIQQPLHSATEHQNSKRNSSKPSNMSFSPNRLSHEEQQELLEKAVKLRTLKQIQQEVTLRTPNRSPSQLVLARASGFGDDIFAYQDAITEGQDAREELVTTNLGLVHYCVNDVLKTRRQGLSSLSRDDLVQEGCIGLARAVDRWNLEIGGRFSTYAMYWVRAAILRCIAERDEVVRVPEHVSAAVRKVTRAAKTLGIEINGDSILWSVSSTGKSQWKEAQAAKALAEEAGLTERQLAEAIRVRERRNKGVLSFESYVQNGRELGSDPAESGIQAREDVDNLTETLSRFLRPKEMEALSWRYGLISESTKPAEPIDYLAEAEEALFGTPQSKQSHFPDIPVKGKQGEAMSFVEVGKKMQVSAEYTRKLVHTALDKLRRAAEEGHLEPVLIG